MMAVDLKLSPSVEPGAARPLFDTHMLAFAPVDQYVVHHPEFLLEGSPEQARVDPDNLHVLLAHLRDETGCTFILVTHDSEVGEACDRIVRMRDGVIRPPVAVTPAPFDPYAGASVPNAGH